jgi:Aspartyl protease
MKSIHLPLLVTDPTLNLLLEDYRLRSLLAQEDVVAAGVARKIGLVAAANCALHDAARRGQRKTHLSTLRPSTDSTEAPQTRAILAAAAGRERQRVRMCRRSVRTAPLPRRALRYLLLVLFLFTPLPNSARPDTLQLPFRTVRSMILVQGKVNGRPVVFLLDTGATRTIVSAKSYGNLAFRLHSVERTSQGPGIAGDSVALPIYLELGTHIWAGQRVAVMNLDGLNLLLGTPFDGLLGQDVLREFRSVRIDYRTHTVELEE